MATNRAAEAASTTQLGNGSPTMRGTASEVVVVASATTPASVALRGDGTSGTLPAADGGDDRGGDAGRGGDGDVDGPRPPPRSRDVHDAGGEPRSPLHR